MCLCSCNTSRWSSSDDDIDQRSVCGNYDQRCIHIRLLIIQIRLFVCVFYKNTHTNNLTFVDLTYLSQSEIVLSVCGLMYVLYHHRIAALCVGQERSSRQDTVKGKVREIASPLFRPPPPTWFYRGFRDVVKFSLSKLFSGVVF